MAKRYELIREIFNRCSGNQMRDVFVSEVETDDTDAYMRHFLVGGAVSWEKTAGEEGALVYDLTLDGLHSRLTFTEI